MTFCVGIKVREGIVALADTRIVRGSERLNKHKLATLEHANESLVTMTSGLRSVRDKALIYLSEALEGRQAPLDRVYQVVNLFGDQLRRVRQEDGDALIAGNLTFNSHAIIGGRLPGDIEPQLFYVYPEGNWIEAAQDSPYFMIGRTSYGKPILDRLLSFETPLRSAIALALLAFDATRTSVTDVDCPVDIAVMSVNSRRPTIQRFTEADLTYATQWWSQTLVDSLHRMPMQWADVLFTPSS